MNRNCVHKLIRGNPLLKTLCIYSRSTEWYIYFEQFATIAPICSTEWYTYFEQFATIAPIRNLNPYFEH
jgi:hypothetical protein